VTAPAPTSIALTAATLTGNHGAEAMLLATVGRLRERLPCATFEVFSHYARADAARVTDPAVRFHRLRSGGLVFRLVPLAALLALARRCGLGGAVRFFPADVRALVGCSVLVDLAGVSFMTGRERYLAFNTLTLVPAFLLGVPVVKASQAMGPFTSWMNRALARRVLGRCEAVFTRGERSFAHVQALLGPGPRVRRAADVAFLLGPHDALGQRATPAVAQALAAIGKERARARSVVGLCPSSLLMAKDPARYTWLFSTLAVELAAAGDLVVLLPHATLGSADAGARSNDLWAIGRVLAALPPEVRSELIAVEEDVHAVELLGLLGALDLAVVSRFHAMVGALCGGVPPVVVGWSHKYREVMEEFDLGERALDVHEATPARVQSSLDALRSDLSAHRVRIRSRLDTVRQSALAQIEHTARIARSPRGPVLPGPLTSSAAARAGAARP
jgi:polysaccharide pyruvyl transferase WcaK-like protein